MQMASVWLGPPGSARPGGLLLSWINQMTPDCVLVQQPAIDFGTFLGVSREALGFNPADASDGSARDLPDAEKWLSCLAALSDRQAKTGLTPNLLAHVQFSFLVVVDERDALGVFQVGAGMPFVVADTVQRGILLAVMTGNLAQWRDAVKSGTAPTNDASVRTFYTKVLLRFEEAGLGSVWQDFERKTSPDHLLYLENR